MPLPDSETRRNGVVVRQRRRKTGSGMTAVNFRSITRAPGTGFFSKTSSWATRLVTNSEYREFIEDGGYSRPELWLSDGWNVRQGTSMGRTHVLGARTGRVVGHDVGRVSPFDRSRAGLPRQLLRSGCISRDGRAARLPTEFEWERRCTIRSCPRKSS